MSPYDAISPPQVKQCRKCGESKPVGEFYFRKDGKRRNPCKACTKAKVKAYQQTPERKAYDKAREQTPERKAKKKAASKSPERKAQRKAHHQSPEGKAKQKAWNQSPEGKAAQKVYYQSPEGKAKQKAWRNAWRQSDLGQLRGICKNAAKRLFLGKRSQSKLKLLSYTSKQATAHLESTLPAGMTYQQARADGWHVDHIDPLAKIARLPISDDSKIRFAMRLENLRLLPGLENLSRGVGRPEEYSPTLHMLLKLQKLVEVAKGAKQ